MPLKLIYLLKLKLVRCAQCDGGVPTAAKKLICAAGGGKWAAPKFPLGLRPPVRAHRAL